MTTILLFQYKVMPVTTETSVHKPQPFWRERRAEAGSNWGPSAYQPNALPLGQTGSQREREREIIEIYDGSQWL